MARSNMVRYAPLRLRSRSKFRGTSGGVAAGPGDHEQRQQGDREADQACSERVTEAVLAEARDGVDQGDHAARAERGPDCSQVALVGAGGNQSAAAEEDEQADGDVDVVDPPPAQRVSEGTAQEESEHDPETTRNRTRPGVCSVGIDTCLLSAGD